MAPFGLMLEFYLPTMKHSSVNSSILSFFNENHLITQYQHFSSKNAIICWIDNLHYNITKAVFVHEVGVSQYIDISQYTKN